MGRIRVGEQGNIYRSNNLIHSVFFREDKPSQWEETSIKTKQCGQTNSNLQTLEAKIRKISPDFELYIEGNILIMSMLPGFILIMNHMDLFESRTWHYLHSNDN